MNSVERFEAAIHFREVDRMPTDLHNFAVCANMAGVGFEKIVYDPDLMVRMHVSQWEEYGHDVLLVENGTASLAQAMGCSVVIRPSDPPVVTGAALKRIEEAEKMVASRKLLDAPLISANLKAVSILRKKMGNSAVVMGRGDQGPFSLASQLIGMNEFLELLVDEDYEEELEHLLELSTQAGIICCTAMLEAGAHCTSIGDSTAGPDVVSPAMYEKFALPYEKKLVDAIHAEGGPIALHICGNATRIIDKMVLTGADILELDQKTDIAAARPAFENKAAILGQISPLTLMNGTPDKVAEETRDMLGKVGGSKATGVILGPGCALGSTTPSENIHAMLDVVYKS